MTNKQQSIQLLTEHAMERNRFPNFRQVRPSREVRNRYIRQTFLRLLKKGHSSEWAIEYIENRKRVSLGYLSIRDICYSKGEI